MDGSTDGANVEEMFLCSYLDVSDTDGGGGGLCRPWLITTWCMTRANKATKAID